MTGRVAVLLLTLGGVVGCTSTLTRYVDPLDRVVLPLRPGPVESETVESETVESETAGPPKLLRSYVVLLPDDDGVVGQVEVESGGERVLLDRANQAVDFADLTRTFEVDVADAGVFDRSLAAEPPASVQFVVRFDLNAVEPSPAEVERIRGILDSVRSWPAPEVSIIGHTDRRGSESSNQALSSRRVAAVRQLLEREGIEPVDLAVQAFGESRPAVDTADGVAEVRNRRVVVSIR